MPAPTQPVIVNLADFGGPAVAGVTVMARLDQIDFTADGTFISTEAVSALTDVNGQAVLHVFPNALAPSGLGTVGSVVRFSAAIPNSRSLDVLAIVPNAPCNLVSIIAVDTPTGLSAIQQAVRAAIDNRLYPNTYAVAPTTRPDGTPIQPGDRYLNTSYQEFRWNGAAWVNIEAASAASAAAAATSAGAAAGSAAAAGVSATQAGNYVIAAAAAAKFYDTIALGVNVGGGGVAVGAAFGVRPGQADGLARPTVYKNVDGTAGNALKLYEILDAGEFKVDVGGGADFLIVDTFAQLPAGVPRGKYALVVADRLPVTSVSRSRGNGVPFLVFNTNHGLAVGANVNVRGFGGVGYNGHFTLRTASGTFIDYKSLTTQAGESTTADTAGYLDRNGVYQYNGSIWSWVADIGQTFPIRSASLAAARASSVNKTALDRTVFDRYFNPVFQPLQRVMTVSEVGTISVDCTIPNAPDWQPAIYADGVSLGLPTTKSGLTYSVPYTAPGAVDLDIDLTAIADSRQGAAKLAVAEAVRFSQDLTTWTKTNITSVTGGQADPDGGNNAYRVLCTANGSAAQHNILSPVAVPASTGPLVGFEVWAKPDTSNIIEILSSTNQNDIAYVNLVTGEIQTQNINCAIVERRGAWCKIWWQQRWSTPASQWRLYPLVAFGNSSVTSAGTEAVFFYKPRQIDGVLPFFKRQKAAWVNAGGIAYATRYAARSDYMDAANNSMTAPVNVDVVVPDTYTPTKRYPVLYIREVEATPGTSYQDGLQTIKALNVHNVYDCILVRNYHQVGDVPWDGVKNDGTFAHATFLEECVIDFIDRKYSTIRSREGRLLVGFSKSGFGSMSYLLRRPDLFGYAACWDVPWGLQFNGTDNYVLDAFGNPSVNAVGQDTAFGTQAQFQLYNPADILAANLSSVNDKCRVVLGGAAVWEGDLTYFRGLLDANSVPYMLHYTSPYTGDSLDHNWTPPHANMAWLPSMLAMMFSLR